MEQLPATMTPLHPKQVRRAERLKYFAKNRPNLYWNMMQFPIVNLSTSGIKIIAKANADFPVKGFFNCEIRLLQGRSLICQVSLVRRVGDLYMLKFRKPIPAPIWKIEKKMVTE